MPARSDSPFEGELFRSLAAEGRLRLEAGQADAAIAGLEHTLSEVRARLRILRGRQLAAGSPGELSDEVVDAVFADQLAPGRLELATVEIPKYIEALRRARR